MPGSQGSCEGSGGRHGAEECGCQPALASPANAGQLVDMHLPVPNHPPRPATSIPRGRHEITGLPLTGDPLRRAQTKGPISPKRSGHRACEDPACPICRATASPDSRPRWGNSSRGVGSLGTASLLDAVPAAGGCARAGCPLCRATAWNRHPDHAALRQLLQVGPPRAWGRENPGGEPAAHPEWRHGTSVVCEGRSPIRDVLTELALRQTTVEGISFVVAAQQHLAAVGASRRGAVGTSPPYPRSISHIEAEGGGLGPTMRQIPLAQVLNGPSGPRSGPPRNKQMACSRGRGSIQISHPVPWAPRETSSKEARGPDARGADPAAKGQGPQEDPTWQEAWWPVWGELQDACAGDQAGVSACPVEVGSGATVYIDMNRTTTYYGKGTAASPWNLTQARAVLGIACRLPGMTFVLMSTGAPWTIATSGMQEVPTIGYAMLHLRASGAPGEPLIIQSQEPISGTSFVRTTLDGGFPDNGKLHWYGIFLDNVTDVLVHNIEITGFHTGIRVHGRCRRVAMEYLESSYNAIAGIGISAGQDEEVLLSQIGDEYPACILIEGCELHDNGCGCHSAATQVSIGQAATNVTIRGCTIYCEDANRGTDGITADEASSGHVIEYNEIYKIPFLRVEPACGPDCDDDKRTSDTEDGDGIDLKEVRQRTLLSGERTVVRYNAIHHCDGNGILVHQGTHGLEIYANEIFGCGSQGIAIATGNSDNPDDVEAGVIETGDINIYRNLIYGLTGELSRGIQLKAGGSEVEDDVAIAGVRIVNNTIDGCSYAAVQVVKRDAKAGISDVVIMNNIFSRSNVPDHDTAQLDLGGSYDDVEATSFVIDGNLYVPSTHIGVRPREDAPLIVVSDETLIPASSPLTLYVLWSYDSELSWRGRNDTATDPLNPTQWLFGAVVDPSYRPVADSPALFTGVLGSGVLHYESDVDVLRAFDFLGVAGASHLVVGAISGAFAIPFRNRYAG